MGRSNPNLESLKDGEGSIWKRRCPNVRKKDQGSLKLMCIGRTVPSTVKFIPIRMNFFPP